MSHLLELPHEVGAVPELPVDGGKSDVGHLVEVAQALHDELPDLFARDLLLGKVAELGLDLIGELFESTSHGQTIPPSCRKDLMDCPPLAANISPLYTGVRCRRGTRAVAKRDDLMSADQTSRARVISLRDRGDEAHGSLAVPEETLAIFGWRSVHARSQDTAHLLPPLLAELRRDDCVHSWRQRLPTWGAIDSASVVGLLEAEKIRRPTTTYAYVAVDHDGGEHSGTEKGGAASRPAAAHEGVDVEGGARGNAIRLLGEALHSS